MVSKSSVPPISRSESLGHWSLETATRASFLLFLRWVMLVTASVLAFALAGNVLTDNCGWLDVPVIHAADSVRTPALTWVMRGFSFFGDGASLPLIAIGATVVLFFARWRPAALFVALSSSGAAALNATLKLVIARPRPLVLAHLASASGYSFPSGHAMASAAIYGAVAIVLAVRAPRYAVWILTVAFLLVVAVGASRVYLGVHYPSDVLVGWALGVSWPLWLRPLLLADPLRVQKSLTAKP